jgi:predicted amino acid racemase
VFLSATRERNPELLATAASLHQAGAIPPDTFVIDIDRVTENAEVISSVALEHGISLYAMTKQAGRNPFMALAARTGGIPAAVAVDFPEARVLHLHGIPMGHVGHLVQTPSGELDAALDMRPEMMTVFSGESAARLAEVANRRGMEQPLMLRILEDGDFLYRGQEGGFRLSDLPAAVARLQALRGVCLAGVTAFPCLLFNYESQEIEETPNFGSLLRAAEIMRDLGVTVSQVNAPSVTCAGTIPLLAARGATHGEPGSALTGSTPLHARGREPEVPALVYVSEVAGVREDRAYCLGGGFYARSRVAQALILDRTENVMALADVDPLPAEAIDYYGSLRLPTGVRMHIGDTVLFAFRSQIFVSRSRVAAVAGIARGQPRLLGICDAVGNLLGEDLLPVGSAEAVGRVKTAWEEFEAEYQAVATRRQISQRRA